MFHIPPWRALVSIGRDKYLLRDEFDGVVPAGSVNGTYSNSGHTRTVVDTDSKLSVSGGVLNMAAHSTPAWGDPGLWYPAITRAAGTVLLAQINAADVTKNLEVGWDTGQAGALNGNALRILSDTIKPYDSGAAGPVVGVPVDATDYVVAIVLRASGAQYYIKGGTFTTWTKLWQSATDSTATLYAALANYDMVPTDAYVRIAKALWMGRPLASDSFNGSDAALGSTDGAGHAETTGVGSGGSGHTWTGATWGTVSNVAVNTPTEGAVVMGGDTLNGNMETGDPPTGWVAGNVTLDGVADERTGGAGAQSISITSTAAYGEAHRYAGTQNTWVLIDWWAKSVTGQGAMLYIGGNIRGTTNATWTNFKATLRLTQASPLVAILANTTDIGAEVRFDDITIKPLTLSTLFASLTDLGESDVMATVEVTLTAGTQAGLVVNLDSAAYHDGTNAKLDKCVAGTYTSVISAAATYGVGRELRVVKDGTSYALFYHNAKIGSTSTISDAGIKDNTIHGLFSTSALNSLDDYTCYKLKENKVPE